MDRPQKPDIVVAHRESISSDRLDALDKMIDYAFFAEWGPPSAEDASIEWAAPEVLFVAYIENKPVSHVGLLRRAVRVAGVEVVVGGIGGVSTHPDFLRRGYAHLLMREAHEYMLRDGGFAFGMLFCDKRRITLYESLGYSVLTAPLWMTQHGERKLFDSQKMALPLTSTPWPVGEIDIQGLPW